MIINKIWLPKLLKIKLKIKITINYFFFKIKIFKIKINIYNKMSIIKIRFK